MQHATVRFYIIRHSRQAVGNPPAAWHETGFDGADLCLEFLKIVHSAELVLDCLELQPPRSGARGAGLGGGFKNVAQLLGLDTHTVEPFDVVERAGRGDSARERRLTLRTPLSKPARHDPAGQISGARSRLSDAAPEFGWINAIQCRLRIRAPLFRDIVKMAAHAHDQCRTPVMPRGFLAEQVDRDVDLAAGAQGATGFAHAAREPVTGRAGEGQHFDQPPCGHPRLMGVARAAVERPGQMLEERVCAGSQRVQEVARHRRVSMPYLGLPDVTAA